MTLANIINARRALAFLNESMDFATAYKIAKFIDKTDSEQKFFDQQTRDILDKYKEGDTIPDEKVADANKEIELVTSTEVEDPGIRFAIEDFKGVKLTPAQAFQLLSFME